VRGKESDRRNARGEDALDQALLVAICGATATGKTAVAAALARALGGEIVAADSRTIYRGMNIGTAKPTPEQRAAVPHHLLDVADPAEVFTVAQYQQLAVTAVADILARGHLPLLVGGSGLYIRAVVDGLQIPHVPPDWSFRKKAEVAERERPGSLYERLQRADPRAAERIHPRNLRRIIRALEVIERSGRPISEQQRAQPAPWRVVMTGLRMPRPLLYERIHRRVDDQITQGLVEEVRGLLLAGARPRPPCRGSAIRRSCPTCRDASRWMPRWSLSSATPATTPGGRRPGSAATRASGGWMWATPMPKRSPQPSVLCWQ